MTKRVLRHVVQGDLLDGNNANTVDSELASMPETRIGTHFNKSLHQTAHPRTRNPSIPASPWKVISGSLTFRRAKLDLPVETELAAGM